jgi:hypothetical protein
MIATIILISQKWQKNYGNKTFYTEKECLTKFQKIKNYPKTIPRKRTQMC